MTALPLSGIQIIDATSVLMGPYASQWLGDLGAEVIKLEAPAGDSTRHTGPTTEPGMAAVFMGTNRNKKSVVIDLKQTQGQQALDLLLQKADVFMHSIRPQKLAAIGLDHQRLRSRYPGLIFASLNGFAEEGPYGGDPAYDDIIQGMSGATALTQAQSGEPRFFPMAYADKTSGMVAAISILAALHAKQANGGQGCKVEIPMFESMVSFNMVEHFYGHHFPGGTGATGYPRVLSAWRKPYPTLDGHVCLMPYTDTHWQKFFIACDRPDLAADPRFSRIDGRTRHIETLYEITGNLVAQQTTAHWLKVCEQADIPASVMNQLDDLESDPHLLATGYFQQLHDPAMGDIKLLGVPVLFDGQRPPSKMPPRLGQHTLSVLRACGASEDQLQNWLSNGAIQI
jgi:crotonobetainyl-CoA:carnitine CoA-transferase CaiB-like acyl-CoA transferase